MQRGYRERSPRRDRGDRDREGRDMGRDRDGRDRDGGRDRDSERDGGRGDHRDGRGDRYRGDGDRRGDRSNYNRDRDRDRDFRHPDRQPDRRPKDKPASAPKKQSAPVGPGTEMIIVTVNDRLGTKAQIPALPSDTIKQFKVMVAMKIGREPHEILLKRQGERPFRDVLTLADCGISHGVQLDLEVDTGD